VNLLAHAFLANGDPERIVGQLCGDFVRGSNLADFPPAIQSGIRCHRAVDSYTDKHPDNLVARNLFTVPHRRFAGIVVDVVYDHFLAKEWQSYCEIPLQDYTTLVNATLKQHQGLLPAGLVRFSQLLASEDTLQRNLHRDHIELTLQRIAGRSTSLAPLATVSGAMWAQETALKSTFDSFFPQLVSYTRSYQKKLALRSHDGE